MAETATATVPETSKPAVSAPAAPAISTSAPAAASAPADYSKFIGSDGTFKEGWKDALLPDDLKDEKFYDAWGTDVKSILKVAGSQAKMLGKYANTKGVLPINERSTDTERQAFRDAMGIPEDSSGYKYTPPEGISAEDFSPELQKVAFDAFNKGDFTPQQVKVAMDTYCDYVKQIEQAVVKELNDRTIAAQKRLTDEWGDQYDSRQELSQRFITKITGLWPEAKYKELFGDEVTLANGQKDREGGINTPEFATIRPLLLDLFASIEEKYGLPDSAAVGETGAMALKTIEQQLQELEATPGFSNGDLSRSLNPADRTLHETLMKKRHDLIAKQVELENKTK